MIRLPLAASKHGGHDIVTGALYSVSGKVKDREVLGVTVDIADEEIEEGLFDEEALCPTHSSAFSPTPGMAAFFSTRRSSLNRPSTSCADQGLAAQATVLLGAPSPG